MQETQNTEQRDIDLEEADRRLKEALKLPADASFLAAEGGFSYDAARAALKATDGDFDAAYALLLDSPDAALEDAREENAEEPTREELMERIERLEAVVVHLAKDAQRGKDARWVLGDERYTEADATYRQKHQEAWERAFGSA